MKKQKLRLSALVLACLIGFACLFSAASMADDEHGRRGLFEREDQHRIPFLETDNEGNETAGQIAAWLLVAANLPVVLSILIKWTNRYVPMNTKLKNGLSGFNRIQKKHLMRFHYLLNPIVLGIALWHWLSSRCKSTAMPEWGLIVMVGLIALGLIMKLGLCPKPLRKSIYRLHTQPVVLVAMVTVLTIGHLIVD